MTVLVLGLGLLILGWLLGLMMGSNPSEGYALEVLTALGTVGAAGVAVVAVSLNLREQRRQVEREIEAKKPLLIASGAEAQRTVFYGGIRSTWGSNVIEPAVIFKLRITLTNMSAFPVYIWRFDEGSRTSGWRHSKGLDGFLIEPGKSEPREVDFTVKLDLERGLQTVFFYHFQSSSTGQVWHYLPVPVRITSHFEDHTYPITLYVELGHSSRERGAEEPPRDWNVYGEGPEPYLHFFGEPHMGEFELLDPEDYAHFWPHDK
jgi:hypothetical protein